MIVYLSSFFDKICKKVFWDKKKVKTSENFFENITEKKDKLEIFIVDNASAMLRINCYSFRRIWKT